MKRFSLRLFAVGLALCALGAAAVIAGSAYARTTQTDAMKVRVPARHARSAKESGQPVIDWNRVLLSIVNTPGAQPANIQPTRNFAILHAAIYDAVNSIDRTHEPYLISVRAPRDASETAAADAAAQASGGACEVRDGTIAPVQEPGADRMHPMRARQTALE